MHTTKKNNDTTILGSITTCESDEHPYLRGSRVRIVAVLKNAAKPDFDDDDYAHIDDEEALAYAGGVTADDRIEVQPWIEKEDRFSFATSDPKAEDLECFAQLRQRA